MADEIGGPYITLASFCQAAITEANQLRQLTVVRILDQIIIPIPKLPPGMNVSFPTPPAQVTLALVIKSGVLKGKVLIKMQPISPSGKPLPAAEFSALLEGEERGIQVIIPMQLVFDEEGVYWFEIGLENPKVLLTKVPLRIMHNEVPVKQMGTAR
jgi:hypothetical protein